MTTFRVIRRYQAPYPANWRDTVATFTTEAEAREHFATLAGRVIEVLLDVLQDGRWVRLASRRPTRRAPR